MIIWCILRCSAGNTLRLARSLKQAGFETWTPAIVEVRRAGLRRTRQEITRPLLPDWVFADASRTNELLALSHSEMPHLVFDPVLRRMVARGYPQFTILGGGYRRPIPDAELHHLRLAERKGAPTTPLPAYKPGDRVKLTEAGFEGLIGTVDAVRGKWTWVTFEGLAWTPRVPTWVLLPAVDNQTQIGLSHRDIAA